MVKKRNAKLGSKTSNRQTSLAEKTEQILLTMPRIIATQIGKDLLVQKQQAAKLNMELKKVNDQKKKLMQRLVELKKKTTAAARKQASTTQKALQKVMQVYNVLVRSMEMVRKQITTLTQKKAMYSALQAQLITFQRDWAKKMSSQAKPMPKAKPKAKKKATALQATKQKILNPVTNSPQNAQIMEVIEVAEEDRVEFAQDPLMKVS